MRCLASSIVPIPRRFAGGSEYPRRVVIDRRACQPLTGVSLLVLRRSCRGTCCDFRN